MRMILPWTGGSALSCILLFSSQHESEKMNETLSNPFFAFLPAVAIVSAAIEAPILTLWKSENLQDHWSVSQQPC